jgi:uncharacterized protein
MIAALSRLAPAALLLALLAVLPAFAQPRFPALSGRVVDEAQILSPQVEAQLANELAQLETQTGRQLVVATIASLQGYPIEEYGYQLGRTWGIGQAQKNDGVVFIVAPNDREVRIEVGYGLEPVLTDALSSVILSERVLPRFRAGEMEAGVVDGARAVAAQLALPADEAAARVAAASEQSRAAADDGPGLPPFLVTLLVIWILMMLLRGGGFGGFSGGGGSFGGGGASGRW